MALFIQFLWPILALNFSLSKPIDNNGLTSTEKKSILDAHNKYRTELDIAPLEWDEDLEEYSKIWANELQKKCVLKHRPTQGKFKLIYGENIAMNMSEDASYAVEQWGSEKKDFKPRSMRKYQSSYLMKVGHYTQIIWAKTTKVGCARVKCKNGYFITVCNYDPPGNYRGETVY